MMAHSGYAVTPRFVFSGTRARGPERGRHRPRHPLPVTSGSARSHRGASLAGLLTSFTQGLSMTYTRLGTLAFAALAFAAAPAKAQFVHFGLTGGVTFPSGDFSQQQDRGYNGGALLAFDAPMLPIGLRADASFHHFPG